jgi:nicotinamidase-related amidase
MADLSSMPGFKDGKWEVPEWSFDGDPALVICHMQMAVVGSKEGAFAEEREAIDRLGIIEQQKKLIAAFREKRLPICFVAVIMDGFGSLPKWGFIFDIGRQMAPKGHLDNPIVAGGCGIIPELGRLTEEPVFCHQSHSPLTGSMLGEYLRQLSVKEIVLTGWTAHSILYNAMLDFTRQWFSVVVPQDATGSSARDQDCADVVLNKMMRTWGLVTTVEDVIAHL